MARDFTNIYEQGLDRREANYQPLTPIDFLKRSADIYPQKTAIIHGARSWTYAQFYQRCRRMAGALVENGIGLGHTVAVIAPNSPTLLESHFSVPMAGAVLNAINTRLDARTIGRLLEHGEARLLVCDYEYLAVAREALSTLSNPPPLVVDWDGSANTTTAGQETDYESYLTKGDPDYEWRRPKDEWQALALNYTSGTTGNPKGVVYHHRGAFLNAMGNAMMFGLNDRSIYLWTLPMFHCNGWSYPWAVTAVGATHVCMRSTDPGEIFQLIDRHRVSHLCGAPIILNMLIHADERTKIKFAHEVEIATGGASPPSAVIAGMEEMGFRVTHLYGLTESYGPATICAWQTEWDRLDNSEKARKIARQGVRNITLAEQMVMDPETLKAVPSDGETLGEVMLKGNTLMKGYLKNGQASDAAFSDSWFHTGDLAVVHEDGYIEIKDRSKDIIISGGENISSLEIEEVLYRHPDVMEAAVVAKPDSKWGETPCAFVMPRPGVTNLDAANLKSWCHDNLARFKCPKYFIFGELPKTSTGKVQKYVLRERSQELDEQ
ncbi:MAG: acyl-CoA synthetase [Methyloligellaceae bacterium]